MILSESFGGENVSIVAEEDVQSLADSEGLLAAVVNSVNECLAEAPRFGLKSPKRPLTTSQILEAISRCNSSGGPSGRHWVLDPVDGTLGFIRGDQYAVALALIDEGKVVIGVLGCPNYPMKKELLSYPHKHDQDMMKQTATSGETGGIGRVLYAKRGSGEAWVQPLIHGVEKLQWPNSARKIRVSSIVDPALATVCEPVERGNSNHSLTAGVAHNMGLRFV